MKALGRHWRDFAFIPAQDLFIPHLSPIELLASPVLLATVGEEVLAQFLLR